MSTKQKWLTYAITGLLTIGFGLSLLGEAIIIKLNASGNWFLWGTSALVVFNSGICLFGQAVIEKTKI
ncbi:MAG: hypothetical protein ACO39T_02675 [Flavobacteriaceae bacterium]|jgi:hypothetical protein|nr:hypothetical protein [Bacteroidota bacterium]MDA1345486.1 hypothetical protein [Bacteroidota bacterium]